jgi:LPS sulfotransferase NodH
MERITSFREAHPELEGRFIDVKYHELISDPMAIVRQIYRRLDLRLTERAAEGMQRLASRRSRYKGRRDGLDLADLESDGTLDRRRLEAYCFRFELPASKWK